MLEENFRGLNRRHVSESDHELALQHAPLIRFDAKEPFLPSAAGYTVFRETAASDSFPREIQFREDVAAAIEYAIWWDWDIQHLYELEHVWVYLDDGGNLVAAEASWHGGFNRMRDDDQCIPMRDNRLALYSEPGKHAFAPAVEWLLDRKTITDSSCGVHAGKRGVHVTPLFKSVIQQDKPYNNRLVHTWLERRQFEPSYDFSQVFDLRRTVLVPWRNLFKWIPVRVDACLKELRATIPPDQLRVLRIAHRGASAYARENSAESLCKAADLGADMVEIDIRTTADNIPVVTHDSSLKRMHGIDGSVSDYRLSELSRLTAAQGEIIRFDEALELCKRLSLGLYLDIKQLTVPAALAMLESLEHHHYMKRTVFGSFRPDYLADIKAARPDAKTSILFKAVGIDAVKLAQSIRADYVHPCWQKRAEQPHRLLTKDWIDVVRSANLGIVCWHEERPAEIAALKALGVDAICSDKPELLC